MNKNLPQSIKSSSLQRIENKINLTKTLIDRLTNEWVVDFFVDNIDVFEITILLFTNVSIDVLKKIIEKMPEYDLSVIEDNLDYMLWDQEKINFILNTKGWEKFYLNIQNKTFKWNEKTIEFILNNSDKTDIEKKYMISHRNNIIWTRKLIDYLSDYFDWDVFSDNCNIQWSNELFEEYIDKWHFGNLARNVSFPWDINKINTSITGFDRLELRPTERGYRYIFGWFDLSKRKLNWTDELIDRFKDYWNWDCLSCNNSVPWNMEMIQKYNDYIEFSTLSYSDNKYIPWTYDFIKLHENKVNWIHLLNNNTIQYNEKIYNLIKSKLPIYVFTKSKYFLWDIFIVKNDYKIISQLIKSFGENWYSIDCILSQNKDYNYDYLYNRPDDNQIDVSYVFYNYFHDIQLYNENKLTWTIEFINEFKEYWDWNKLSSKIHLQWSIELIRTFKENWNWKILSQNNSIHWDSEYLNLFEEKLDWYGISESSSVLWTEKIIDKYEDKLKWRALSSNKSLPWTFELIEKYKVKWEWFTLSNNHGIIWDIRMFKHFYEKIVLYQFFWRKDDDDEENFYKKCYDVINEDYYFDKDCDKWWIYFKEAEEKCYSIDSTIKSNYLKKKYRLQYMLKDFCTEENINKVFKRIEDANTSVF